MTERSSYSFTLIGPEPPYLMILSVMRIKFIDVFPYCMRER